MSDPRSAGSKAAWPAIVVHGLDHARQALGPGRPVCLLSARGAGRYAGAAWWRALIEAALTAEAVDRRDTVFDVLDCDDAPGAAMAALRQGQTTLILDRRCAAFDAVTAAAALLGCEVMDRRPPALDLALPRALTVLPGWLASSGLP